MNLIVERLVELLSAGENVRNIWADVASPSPSVTFTMAGGTTSVLDLSRLNALERDRQWNQMLELKRVLSGVTISHSKG